MVPNYLSSLLVFKMSVHLLCSCNTKAYSPPPTLCNGIQKISSLDMHQPLCGFLVSSAESVAEDHMGKPEGKKGRDASVAQRQLASLCTSFSALNSTSGYISCAAFHVLPEILEFKDCLFIAHEPPAGLHCLSAQLSRTPMCHWVMVLCL